MEGALRAALPLGGVDSYPRMRRQLVMPDMSGTRLAQLRFLGSFPFPLLADTHTPCVLMIVHHDDANIRTLSNAVVSVVVCHINSPPPPPLSTPLSPPFLPPPSPPLPAHSFCPARLRSSATCCPRPAGACSAGWGWRTRGSSRGQCGSSTSLRAR